MIGYIARRVLMTLPTLLLVAVAVFVMMRLIPGDPVLLMLGDSADAAQIAQARQQLGLDQALPAQFVHWLARVLQGDFGQSISNSQPVLPLLLERFQVSASIVLMAVLIAALIAVPQA
jgi:peptide/nickel transport system permease protein